ncbi:hypothetical protein [Motiliproteus sp. SC1-56]|uniref:hypothetical protein n=1 Tax=Motiliproteus sp. SC1-56 TaxID=2799565 RepID=UPI001A8F777B|nr:hypothetical protein [Motiliproteus sp. SC1-56]
MSYPVIIAFELSTPDPEGFPVAVAWSLPGGEVKHTLISPEDAWLERDHGYLEVDPQQLLMEGHSAKAVLQELREDLGEEALYAVDLHGSEQALEAVEEALDTELDLPLRPLAELFAGVPGEERELCRQESESLLGMDLHSAVGQVRLWLEMVHRCGL